ncbi:MAG: hypothetical protein IKU63_02900 [Bacteroidaceae bacterium]|nr:hypothetical protein [Bacteroidaceae bacterium]
MRKVLFVLTLLFTSFSINGYAQTEEVEEGKKRVYCELVGTGNLLGNKMKVSVDFGQRVTWLSDQQLVDENGKKIKFNSMVDAMNYMGRFKWKFIQAYAIRHDNSNVYHFLLYKDIVNDNEITEGFRTKEQYDNENVE